MPNDGSLLRAGRKGTPLLVGMKVSMESVIREESNALIATSVIKNTYKQRLKEHLLGHSAIGVIII